MNELQGNGVEIIYPRGGRALDRARRSRSARTVLTPLSWIYGAAIRCLRAAGAPSGGRFLPGAAVISVGNIEIGGTGKTPFAIHLIEQLSWAGHAPLYISRGYRSVSERLAAVTVVAPSHPSGCTAPAPGIRIIDRECRSLAREIGDEGAVVARRLPDVPLLFSKRKRRALEIARDLFSPTHIVLDDAFQSWRLHRDVDIVLLDPRAPFGNGRLLPAGTLREERAALQRADLIGILGEAGPDVVRCVEAAAGREGSPRSRLFAGRRRITFADGSGEPVSLPRGPVAAISAIARPARFEAMVRDSGSDLACSLRYPDHYRYGQGDVDYIRSVLASRTISTAVMTEKDWVKLDAYDLGSIVPVHARLTLEIDGVDLIDAIKKPRPRAAVS